MLGRGVAQRLREAPAEALVAPEVAEAAAAADLFVLNLECCISERGERWPARGKPFFFRAPPRAAELLADLGVDCVTLANNHALDYGYDALLDTLDHLDAAGIAVTGAGEDLDAARRPAVLETGEGSVAVVGATDHPADFAAGPHSPGVALADLRAEAMGWLGATIESSDTDVVLVSPHWGPNMVPEPLGYVRAAADALVGAGATLVAGHSAHVFHGVKPPVLFDLGDFIDDYAVDPVLRNDLGLLWLVDIDQARLERIEALPLKLDYCYTRAATGDEAEWVGARLRGLCAPAGLTVERSRDRLVMRL